ncbi:MAG TPA: threonine synthase, partial [Clostridia bacterium]|nr:threonine synthase [Clostridia bacterium]
MKDIMYNSTRGGDVNVPSIKALVKGIAHDGGLYVPTHFHNIGDLNRLTDLSYKNLALKIIRAFFPEFSEREISNYIESTYDNKFSTSQ